MEGKLGGELGRVGRAARARYFRQITVLRELGAIENRYHIIINM